MKLKGFDISEILFKNNIYNSEIKYEIINKLKPFTIFFDDCIGICFIEQKENIINVLKEYGKLSTQGHFINLDNFISNEDISYNYIYIGEFEIDGNEAMKEFSKLLKKEENILLNNLENFEEEWYQLQRKALRICLDKEIKILTNKIKKAEIDLKSMKGIYS